MSFFDVRATSKMMPTKWYSSGVVMSHEPCQPPVTTSSSSTTGDESASVDPTTSKSKIIVEVPTVVPCTTMSAGTSKFSEDLLRTPRSQSSSTPRQPPEVRRPRHEEQVEVPIRDSRLPVQRRLFSDEDVVLQNSNNSRVLTEELGIYTKQKTREYNFDFYNERPLPPKSGQRFQWLSTGQGSSGRSRQQQTSIIRPAPVVRPVIETSETAKNTMIITMSSSEDAAQVTSPSSSSVQTRHPSTLMGMSS